MSKATNQNTRRDVLVNAAGGDPADPGDLRPPKFALSITREQADALMGDDRKFVAKNITEIAAICSPGAPLMPNAPVAGELPVPGRASTYFVGTIKTKHPDKAKRIVVDTIGADGDHFALKFERALLTPIVGCSAGFR
jgi:hypothetical protein